MSADLKELLQILSAALAPVTAIVALGIAYRQHRLESVKFRLQLYERRLAIFNGTVDLLSVIIREGDVRMEDLFRFLRETNQSYFLLGKDTTEYLTEIYKKGVDLRTTSKLLQHSPAASDQERARLAEKQKELLLWLGDQILVSREKFAKHLALDQ